MKHLYFVRHGQSVANVKRIYAGNAETPLTDLGRQQAIAAGKAAKNLHIDYIISSTLSRAYDTATSIAKEIGYPLDAIEHNSLLVERDYAPLIGQPWDLDRDINLVAGVETIQSMLNRGHLIYEYLQTLEFENILVVSHGTFYSALRMAIYPETELIEGTEPDNAEIVQLI